MTKEQILANSTLTNQQKDRVIASFEAAVRFKKQCVFESLNTIEEVVKEIERLTKNYNKRKEAEAKKQKAENEVKSKVASLEDLVRKSKKESIDIDDILKAAKKKYAIEHNKTLKKRIAEIESQMLPEDED